MPWLYENMLLEAKPVNYLIENLRVVLDDKHLSHLNLMAAKFHCEAKKGSSGVVYTGVQNAGCADRRQAAIDRDLIAEFNHFAILFICTLPAA